MRRDFARSSDAALPGAGFRGAVDCSDAAMMFRVSSPATIALAPGAPGHKTDGMSRHRRKGLERATGIEPVSLAWKAVAIMQNSYLWPDTCLQKNLYFAGKLSVSNSWSGRRESNPHLLLGRQGSYHYTTPAQRLRRIFQGALRVKYNVALPAKPGFRGGFRLNPRPFAPVMETATQDPRDSPNAISCPHKCR